jgi:hypothetical protein
MADESPAPSVEAVEAGEGTSGEAKQSGGANGLGIDNNTKKIVQKIPLLRTRAGPRDGDKWVARLKEEYKALITVLFSPCCALDSQCLQYIKFNKAADNDWFTISSNKTGITLVSTLLLVML